MSGDSIRLGHVPEHQGATMRVVGANPQPRYGAVMAPSFRKPLGVLLIVVLLAVYAGLVALVAGWLSALPALAQAPVYLVLGVVWILPLKPLLRWMETGRIHQ